MPRWEFFKRRRAAPSRPPAESREWIHPSELPSFDALAVTTDVRKHSLVPRVAAIVVAVLLVAGGVVLSVNRGTVAQANNVPAHLAPTLSALPATSRNAAAHSVDLTISWPGHLSHVAALVLPRNLAVTTTNIPVNAVIKGSTATKFNFPVTLVGRDKVMGFSIVRLSVRVVAPTLASMPSSTTVVAVAPIEEGSTKTPQYDWSLTTLGDPTNNAQGVVHYLAVKTDTSLSKDVDAIAVNDKGDVVALLSSRHSWYSAKFVAQVAGVVASGRGCHAELGVTGKDEQGGGVLVTSVVRYGPAAHAHIEVGDVITSWDGKNLNSWDQLVSTLYLTPAYTSAHLTYDWKTTVHHAVVSLNCPSKLVP